jgi:hypothetical protein
MGGCVVYSDGLNPVQVNNALSRQTLLKTKKNGTHLSRRGDV